MTGQTEPNNLQKLISLLRENIDKNTVRNVLYILSAILLFMIGVIIYGIILNIREVSIEEAMMEMANLLWIQRKEEVLWNPLIAEFANE